MADLNMEIALSPQQQMYTPGTQIQGQVTITSPGGKWECDSMELVLFWRTSGIGTKDEGIAHTESLCAKDAQIPANFTRDFQLALPLHPYTYNGKLIKITWYLGLYVKKGWLSKQEIELPVIISPPERASTLAGDLGHLDTAAAIYYDATGKPVE